MKRFRLTISLKTGLVFGLMILVILGCIFMIVTFHVRGVITRMVTASSIELLRGRSSQLAEEIEAYQKLLSFEVMQDVFIFGSPEAIEEAAYTLARSKALGEEISNVFVVWPDGRATRTPGEYLFIGDRPYIQAITRDGRDRAISRPLISRNTQQPGVMMTQAFRDSRGAFRGILAAEVGFTRINDIIRSISIGESSYAWIVDDTGLIFSSAHPDMAMKLNITEADETWGYRGLSGLAGLILSQNETEGFFTTPEGVDRMLFALELPGESGWKFGAIIDRDLLFKPLTDLIFLLTGVIGSGLILALISAMALGHFIAGPLVQVGATLRDLSEGEGDLTASIRVAGDDEISDLSLYFNRTLEKIKNLVISVKGQAGTLAALGGELAANMTETAGAVHQITANIQNIKQRIINQSAGVTETNAVMEQITSNIGKLNSQVERQNARVHKSSAEIEEMLALIQSVAGTLVKNSGNVQELMEASEAGRAGLQDVARDLQQIVQESEDLQKINQVMENISSQTNLLSMNAAIEAAHAGEAGKGFAVVAGEIRKLAESSGNQSKTIRGVLKKIKESMDNIIASTNRVQAKFEAIEGGVKTVALQEEKIREALKEQTSGSRQILQTIEEMSEITRQVTGGSEVMLEGSREVIQESRHLERATQEIAGGMNEMAIGADQINLAVHRINELTIHNRDSINALVREVSRFKVEEASARPAG